VVSTPSAETADQVAPEKEEGAFSARANSLVGTLAIMSVSSKTVKQPTNSNWLMQILMIMSIPTAVKGHV
jgi:hypothetical protein